MSGEVLLDSCPICGQSALVGGDRLCTCSSCETTVEQSRWLGAWPRNRFFIRTVGPGYRNVEFDLIGRPFTRAQLVELADSCYSDADLSAIAAGDLSRLRPPSSAIAQVMFPQTRETCYLQVNGLVRAEGPPLPDGVERIHSSVEQRGLKMLDQGNLFISDQRLIFPSATHTTIRIDRKLTGIHTFTDAFAVQRRGEDKATYFLGFEARGALLVAAYLQGCLDHLR